MLNIIKKRNADIKTRRFHFNPSEWWKLKCPWTSSAGQHVGNWNPHVTLARVSHRSICGSGSKAVHFQDFDLHKKYPRNQAISQGQTQKWSKCPPPGKGLSQLSYIHSRFEAHVKKNEIQLHWLIEGVSVTECSI